MSQQDRIERVRVELFDVINNSMESLLQQAEAVASFIRYYDLNGTSDGYFSQFLQDLETIREGVGKFVPDGNLEPAQALLFTFIKQLHEITAGFNHKWNNYAYWYLQNVLGLKSLPVENHKICLHFTKNISKIIQLEKNSGFQQVDGADGSPVYRLSEEMVIENTSIEKVISVYFNRQKNIRPASHFNFITSLQIKELYKNNLTKEPLFSNTSKPEHTQPLGFMLTSPTLLLREGKRNVSIILESSGMGNLNKKIQNTFEEWKQKLSEPTFHIDLLKNIFYIRISTADGWTKIENYVVKYANENENGNLTLKFTLLEDFPSTAPCLTDIHSFQSDFPTLRVYLNHDAWLYPYSWLRYFLLQKIHIKTEVEGVSNILVYNDLGKVDCSKPFQPFGINTEKGALMVIGNYEMSVKHTRRFDAKIHWGQLPSSPRGFQEYYTGYGFPIGNTSFKVRAYYLSDYQWKEKDEYTLFGALPGAPLSKETVLRDINVEKMPVKPLSEENYNYTIHSKTGFVGFLLESPEMGFGEKQYRKVFSEYFMKEAAAKKRFWKKPKNAPNEPYKPLIENMTLDYVAEETINLHKQSPTSPSALYHISPFGYKQVYPSSSGNEDTSLVYQMDADANILIALRDVRKGGALNFYFDFLPFNKEINSDEIPHVQWFFGNGYQWEAIPDGYVGVDKTTNLLESGFIKFFLPEDLSDHLFDETGRIWLRAAIAEKENVIPCIKNVYINVAEAEIETGEEPIYNPLALTGTQWKTEQNLPGITKISVIASYSGKEKENKEQRLIRFSEYASHRGKAVTARDYERMTLQHFPDIAKVKCLPAFNAKTGKKNGVTLAIIPQQQDEDSGKYLAVSRQILKVEEFFKGRTSAAVQFVDVINPLYEEALARCQVTFKKRYPAASCRTYLSDLLNSLIAPWQQSSGLPKFDYSLNMEKICQEIEDQEFVSKVDRLSFVIICEKKEKSYSLYEYGKNDSIIRPSTPFSIFVPATEHLITSDSNLNFGIDEMTIGDSFIIT